MTWAVKFYRNSYSLSDDESMQIRIKVMDDEITGGDPNDSIHIETSDGGTYRRFGLKLRDDVDVIYNEGSGYYYPATILDEFVPGEWYVVRISVDDNNGFTVEMFLEDDPTVYGSYTRQMSSASDGKNWRFVHNARGTTYLDDYIETDSGTQVSEFEYDELDRLTGAEATAADSIPARGPTITSAISPIARRRTVRRAGTTITRTAPTVHLR